MISGNSPPAKVRKMTANRSCRIRMPIAVRPCMALCSPRSSRFLTAKTVEEKDRANPSASAPSHDSPASAPRPAAPAARAAPANRLVDKTMWPPAVAQTSTRSNRRRSSSRPIMKSSSVTPKSATAFSAGPPANPQACATKPASRNPTNGGWPTCRAAKPNAKAMPIRIGSMG